MKQVKDLNIEDIVFIDTETARNQMSLTEGTADYEAWKYQFERNAENEGKDLGEEYIDKSALYAEFSRLVCISVGRIKGGKLFITTYRDEDEKEMLERFTAGLNQVTKAKPKTVLCGHSVVGFDIPFIMKRCMANGVRPNNLIDVGGLKPWEVTSLDTKTLWKGTSYYASSLISLCLALNIPRPKSDITGAEVADVYYTEGAEGLDRICKYCERDVMAVANIIKRFRFEEIFTDYEAKEPQGKVQLNLIQRISESGEITPEDEAEIIQKVKGSNHKEKEMQIKILKSALVMHGKELSQDLELEILKA